MTSNLDNSIIPVEVEAAIEDNIRTIFDNLASLADTVDPLYYVNTQDGNSFNPVNNIVAYDMLSKMLNVAHTQIHTDTPAWSKRPPTVKQMLDGNRQAILRERAKITSNLEIDRSVLTAIYERQQSASYRAIIYTTILKLGKPLFARLADRPWTPMPVQSTPPAPNAKKLGNECDLLDALMSDVDKFLNPDHDNPDVATPPVADPAF